MKSLLLWSLLFDVVLCSEVAVCLAEEPSAPIAAPQGESAPPKAEAGAPAAPKVESGAPKAPEKSCPAPVVVELPKKPALPPVYVSDPGRLAALTASDPVVFENADALAAREYRVRRLILPAGVLVGGGLVLAGTLGRLNNDHWTDSPKWAVFSGASVVVVTLLISWMLAPEHDDLLTVINHWNLRHPERPLAP